MKTSPSIFIDDEELLKNDVRFIHCENWDDFTKQIKKIVTVTVGENKSEPSEIPNRVIYRGHSLKEWRLSSQLERSFLLPSSTDNDSDQSFKENSKEWYDKVQLGILKKFKFLSEGTPGNVIQGMNEDEIWALGRHNGLITPLLDWTESAYIAAFFAFIEQYRQFEFNIMITPTFSTEGYVYVWGLRLYSGLEIENEFEIVKLPRRYGSRLWAQAGLFTRLHKKNFFDIESYLRSRGIAHYLDCYEIPLSSAAAAIKDLKLMNISYSRLFPDLVGAAQEANIFDQHVDLAMIQNELNKNKS